MPECDVLFEDGDGAAAACAAAEGVAAVEASAGSALVAVTADPASEPVVDVHRFSALTRAVRIMGLVLKLISLLMCRSAAVRRKIGVGAVLSDSEMRAAQGLHDPDKGFPRGVWFSQSGWGAVPMK